jgi:hypothetical protein
MKDNSIVNITHPDYTAMVTLWEKYRCVFNGGDDFIEDWVLKLSSKENDDDFIRRKKLTNIPAYSKSAIIEIKNSIYQRMVDITRTGGPFSYRQACNGLDKGVDKQSRTMNDFIGNMVLPELLVMGRVGVYVDRLPMPENATKAYKNNPYLYTYTAESIRSWNYNENGELIAILLEEGGFKEDEETGLISDSVSYYRLLRKVEEGVELVHYNDDGDEIEKVILSLPKIPFVMGEITQSLLTDVANHQISLVNMSSSDISYAIGSNFPFYVEQYTPAAAAFNNLRNATDNTVVGDSESKNTEITVGATKGRAYPKGTDQPAFINPSSEPLKASMEKQEQLKKEIKQLVNLSLQNLEPRVQAAESREYDNQGLEAGLSYIGLELARIEREIGMMWAMYERSNDIPEITYPKNYSLKTESDRFEQSEKLEKLRAKVPSVTFQKEISKDIATVLLGHKVKLEILKKIHEEIDSSMVVVTDPDVIHGDHEAGLVSTKTASVLRGYDPSEHEQAAKDHAERAARIALAQSKASARGVSDLGVDNADDEKENAKNKREIDPDNQKTTRGENK